MSQLPGTRPPARRGASPGGRRSSRSALSLPAAAVLVVLLVAALTFVVWHNRSGGAAAAGSTPSTTRSVRAASPPSGSTRSRSPQSSAPGSSAPRSSVPGPGGTVSGDVKAKAEAVLAVLDRTGRPPQGFVGGRQFLNDSRGGTTTLPRQDAQGATITYHEYDVNAFQRGVNRGPQRLVVGSDGSAYCTADHYVTWLRLR